MYKAKCVKCGNIVSGFYTDDRCCCGGKLETYEEADMRELQRQLAAERKAREKVEAANHELRDDYKRLSERTLQVVDLLKGSREDYRELRDKRDGLLVQNANLRVEVSKQALRVKALEKVANLARTIQRHKSTLPEQDCTNEEYREVIQAHTDLESQLDEQMHKALREVGMEVE